MICVCDLEGEPKTTSVKGETLPTEPFPCCAVIEENIWSRVYSIHDSAYDYGFETGMRGL